MTYAAYLRIYEPVSAFREPDRSWWAAYAASVGRPRRRDSLWAEHAEALRRAIAAPQVAVPGQESEHAYVRSADGITYICPWQTRLRCLLACRHMLSGVGSPVAGAAADAGAGSAAVAEVGRWLEEFHPHSLVELDYGGLVHLASDEALRGDQSAAEIAAALEGLAKGECELAIAMYKRAHGRWRVFAESQSAN